MQALAFGAVTEEHITGELGQLILGRTPGRESADEITFFDSTARRRSTSSRRSGSTTAHRPFISETASSCKLLRRNRQMRELKTIEMHTCGEPARIVIDGMPGAARQHHAGKRAGHARALR